MCVLKTASASSATSCVPLMTFRSAADTPARFVISMAEKRAAALVEAVPAVPVEIWKSLYAAAVRTEPPAAALTAVVPVAADTAAELVLDDAAAFFLGMGEAMARAMREKVRIEELANFIFAVCWLVGW